MGDDETRENSDEEQESTGEATADITAAASDALSSAAEAVGDAIGGRAGEVADAVSGAADAVGGVVDTAREIAGAASGASDEASDALESASGVAGGASGAVDGIGDAVGDFAGDDVEAGFERAGEIASAADNAASATEAFGSLVDTVRERARSAGGRLAEALTGGGESQSVSFSFDCDEVETSWALTSATLDEGLNRPYSATLHLVDDTGDGEPIQLLGKNCTVTIERGGMMRRIVGIVCEVHEDSTDENEVATTVDLVPAFALLDHRINTKIYQQKTVTEILKEVLEEGLGPYNRSFENRTSRGVPTCEYRTQFDESDLSFCQRLMEEEGIVYWFEHEGDTELLVLADAETEYGSVECLHGDTIRYSDDTDAEGGHEQVSSFTAVAQLTPTKLATRHYDWTHSLAMIETETENEESGEEDVPHGATLAPEREQFEHDWEPLTLHQYGAKAFGANDANDQSRLRREQQAYDARTARGESTVVEMAPGKIFELVNHPRGLDGRYLVITTTHAFSGDRATNSFVCIPAGVPFRPRRVTPKPRVPGIQTARVVGPKGEEIHTDEHGRVKVQFHWDRLGANDDHSSCWVRVMQPWAGAGWGFVFIPRIDMEVVVTFVNGDPDQPLVTGSVYNDANIPPYALPDEKTKSTIYSNSSLGGDGYNELTFEDAAGEEQIITHAQKDYNETVENNHNTTVHGSQTNSVDGDQTESIGGNQSMTVDQDRTVTVHQKHQETVDNDQVVLIHANQSTTVDADRAVTVDGLQIVKVNGGNSDHRVTAGHYNLIVANDIVIKAEGSILIQSGSSTTRLQMDSNSLQIDAGGGASLRLDDKVTLRANGGARVVLTENANITSNGESLMRMSDEVDLRAGTGAKLKLRPSATLVDSSGNAQLRLEDNAELKGTGGGTVTCDANVTIEGAQVKINP